MISPQNEFSSHAPAKLQTVHPEDAESKGQRTSGLLSKQKTNVVKSSPEVVFNSSTYPKKPKNQTQKTMDQFGVSKLSAKQAKLLQRRVAMHFYVTGTPFERVDVKYLQQTFDMCRPGIKLPNRHKLSDELLDSCHAGVV